jgi:hypothetical protein
VVIPPDLEVKGWASNIIEAASQKNGTGNRAILTEKIIDLFLGTARTLLFGGCLEEIRAANRSQHSSESTPPGECSPRPGYGGAVRASPVTFGFPAGSSMPRSKSGGLMGRINIGIEGGDRSV